jgi:hypothetical protein
MELARPSARGLEPLATVGCARRTSTELDAMRYGRSCLDGAGEVLRLIGTAERLWYQNIQSGIAKVDWPGASEPCPELPKCYKARWEPIRSVLSFGRVRELNKIGCAPDQHRSA